MDSLRLDIRYALRALARRPGFTAAAILSLAIGIAANTAVFGIVNGLLFKPVPGVTQPERLVEISRQMDGEWADLAFPIVERFRAERTILEDVAAFAIVPASVVADGEPRVHGGLAVTANYFTLLGVTPERGRLFTSAEASYPAVAAVALITHDMWERDFERADVVGRTIRVNGTPVQVVGVLPAGFAGHTTGVLSDVFLPLGLTAPGLPHPSSLETPDDAVVEAIARLQPGVSAEAAGLALASVANRLPGEGIGTAPASPYVMRVDAWGPLPGTIRGAVGAFAAVLSLLVALALTMACVNVTGMMLARATERRREIALRQALGASGFRIGRQLVTEAVVLFTLAGVIGTLAAIWATSLLGSFAPQLPVPGRVGLDVTFDWRVLSVALIATLGAGVLSGLIPALDGRRVDLIPALKDGTAAAGVRRTRLRSTLVGTQIAVTTLLLLAAGLFTVALRTMRFLDTGWNATGVEVAALDLELRGASEESGRAFYASLLERVRALPGVEAAGVAAKLPLSGCSSLGPVNDGGQTTVLDACFNRMSPGYLATVQLPLRAGRDFSETDRDGSERVAIINETMASRLWPSGDALGQVFYIGTASPQNAVRVVGIASDAKYRRLDEPPSSFYYIPFAQRYNAQMVLHVRAAPGAERSVAASLPQVIREADPYLPFSAPQPMAEAVALALLPQRLAAWVAAVMGCFALGLAAVGVYAVTAFMVVGRTKEIGIRIALGATPASVMRLVMRTQAKAPAIGLGVGLVLGGGFAWFAGQVIGGVHGAAPVAFVAVPAIIALIGTVATLIPVARVLRRDPLAALRGE